MPKEFDITLVTLKGHLLVEEQLDKLLYGICQEPEVLKKERISFDLKLKFLRAYYGDGQFAGRSPWAALAALNRIRNSLSHRVEDPKFDGYVAEFLRLSERAGSGTDPDGQLENRYGGAFGWLMGFLAGAACAAEAGNQPFAF
ncbi:hypothetical protein [Stenotrophomonas rhizophila]|uniref:hypothetical protein n=1 Tax=Stenotrophomonas rhizophila TaxID=216778 RepID=UPI003AF940A8